MVAIKIAQSDFSSSYGNKCLSDVRLMMYEEPGQPDEIPDEQSLGQLELGKLLVKGMYYSELYVAGLTQQQLLQVLLLADRYEVPRFLAAVSTALESIPSAELQWNTAMAVYNLPPGCAELEACESLYTAAAAARCSRQLGDLELVWHDQEDELMWQQLLGLPHQALKLVKLQNSQPAPGIGVCNLLTVNLGSLRHSVTFLAYQNGSGESEYSRTRVHAAELFSAESPAIYWEDFIMLGTISRWAAALEALHSKHLVHPAIGSKWQE
eukprot:gene2661-2961_t